MFKWRTSIPLSVKKKKNESQFTSYISDKPGCFLDRAVLDDTVYPFPLLLYVLSLYSRAPIRRIQSAALSRSDRGCLSLRPLKDITQAQSLPSQPSGVTIRSNVRTSYEVQAYDSTAGRKMEIVKVYA